MNRKNTSCGLAPSLRSMRRRASTTVARVVESVDEVGGEAGGGERLCGGGLVELGPLVVRDEPKLAVEPADRCVAAVILRGGD